MNLTIKREDVQQYIELLTNKNILDIKSDKVAYFIDINLAILEGQLKHFDVFARKSMEERGQLSDEYMNAERELLEKYCEKTETGKPMIKDGRYQLVESLIGEFGEEKKKMSELFPEDAAKQQGYADAVEKYMSEQIELNMHGLLESNVPSDVTPRQRILLREFIVEK